MTRSAGGLLEGRHAVVTGGGRGLGAAIAEALAAEGAHITLMGRTASVLDRHAAVLHGSSGVNVRSVAVDVGDPIAVRRAFAEASAQAGRVDILVNNAGQSGAAPFMDVTLESWERQLRINLTGPFLCIQQVLPAMIAARAGRIVNIASTAALKGYAEVSAYCASKHGVVGLTRALAVETARDGITVNAVCPGYISHTGMLQTAVENVSRGTGRSEEEVRLMLSRKSPRGTLITPQEVAATVLWLCSPGASAITGQAIAVAAGEVMR